jgi:hypothetical protein
VLVAVRKDFNGTGFGLRLLFSARNEIFFLRFIAPEGNRS